MVFVLTDVGWTRESSDVRKYRMLSFMMCSYLPILGTEALLGGNYANAMDLTLS